MRPPRPAGSLTTIGAARRAGKVRQGRAAGGALSLLGWRGGLCVYDWTTGQLRARVPAEDALLGGSWPERDLGVVCLGKPDSSRPINPANACEVRRLSTGEEQPYGAPARDGQVPQGLVPAPPVRLFDPDKKLG